MKPDCPLDANRAPVQLEHDGRVTRHTAVRWEAGLEGALYPSPDAQAQFLKGSCFALATRDQSPAEFSPITAMRVLGATGRRVTYGAF